MNKLSGAAQGGQHEAVIAVGFTPGGTVSKGIGLQGLLGTPSEASMSIPVARLEV
jgi:hypothetical protein